MDNIDHLRTHAAPGVQPGPRAAHRLAAKPKSSRTSELLRDFVAQQSGPRISLGALRDALGDRGFGVLLFIFALPNLVPVNIPLLSAVLGLPLVLLAAQLSYGRHKPWFPEWLTNQTFPRQGFDAVVARALPALERAERLLRPRLSVLLSWTGERLIGIAILVLALVLTLPIPFANWLPAFAIAIIGLAIVEKDGVAVLVGLAVGVAAWRLPRRWSSAWSRRPVPVCERVRLSSQPDSAQARLFELRPELAGEPQPEHAHVAQQRPGGMGHHGRPVLLDQEMSGPGEQITERGARQRDQRIDGDDGRDQRQRRQPGAEHMQEPRALLRVMAEVMLPEFVEALVAAGHVTSVPGMDTPA